jgi:hypothetical protein
VVRLHVLKTENVVEELYNHRVYREVLAMQSVRSKNTVGFLASWFEELDSADQ